MSSKDTHGCDPGVRNAASTKSARFVADGGRRLLRTNEESVQAIRRRVEAFHAEALKQAGPLRRLWLRYKIGCEIRKAVDEIAPSGGLYLRR